MGKDVKRDVQRARDMVAAGALEVRYGREYSADIVKSLLARIDALEAPDAKGAPDARAEAWDQGYAAGYDDAVFDERGLPTDPGADAHPHENPYRRGNVSSGLPGSGSHS